MEKLKYEIHNYYFGSTPCPYKKDITVGSTSCDQCGYQMKQEGLKHIVHCSYKDSYDWFKKLE